MLIDFEIRTDTDGRPALLAIAVEITNPSPEALDYEYKSIYDMTNDVVVFEHELTIEELEMVDNEIISYLENDNLRIAQDGITKGHHLFEKLGGK